MTCFWCAGAAFRTMGLDLGITANPLRVRMCLPCWDELEPQMEDLGNDLSVLLEYMRDLACSP